MTTNQTTQKVPNKRSARFRMFNSPEAANLWFDIFNGVLFTGALLVAIGTWGTIKTATLKEKFSDERISANEAETKRAVAESDKANAALGIAQADIAKANAQSAEATARTKEAELKLEQVQRNLEQRQFVNEEAFLQPLKGLPPSRFRILYVRDTTDVFPLAVSLIIALQKIGWVALENPRPIEAKDSRFPGIPAVPDGSAMSIGGQSTGISVVVKEVESPLGNALMKAFVAAFGNGNVGRNETLPDDFFIIVIAPRL
jgi:hypothetical protein